MNSWWKRVRDASLNNYFESNSTTDKTEYGNRPRLLLFVIVVILVVIAYVAVSSCFILVCDNVCQLGNHLVPTILSLHYSHKQLDKAFITRSEQTDQQKTYIASLVAYSQDGSIWTP